MDIGVKQAFGVLIVIFLAALLLMLTGSLSANDGSKAKSNHGALWGGAENVLLNASESDNLVTNGSLRRGLAGWSGGKIVNDAPAGAKVKQSLQGHRGIWNNEYIPLNVNKTYQLSFDYKDMANPDAKAYSYPAFLVPFDVDKKQMPPYTFYDGGAKSHLTQPLKKGDTVIHVDNINSWMTNKNYYNYIAVYGYKNSKGEIYPDYTYTRNIIQFHNNSTTDKTEINKTNSTITIPAYQGETIPAGTAVSQNQDGANFIYPYMSKTNNNTGWKHIDINFNISAVDYGSYTYKNNEEYIKYIRVGSAFSYPSSTANISQPLVHDIKFIEVD